MGKGDKKTKKGKRFSGSYGVKRQRSSDNNKFVAPKNDESVAEKKDTKKAEKKDDKKEKSSKKAEA